jgi:hypothetical protein
MTYPIGATESSGVRRGRLEHELLADRAQLDEEDRAMATLERLIARSITPLLFSPLRWTTMPSASADVSVAWRDLDRPDERYNWCVVTPICDVCGRKGMAEETAGRVHGFRGRELADIGGVRSRILGYARRTDIRRCAGRAELD